MSNIAMGVKYIIGILLLLLVILFGLVWTVAMPILLAIAIADYNYKNIRYKLTAKYLALTIVTAQLLYFSYQITADILFGGYESYSLMAISMCFLATLVSIGARYIILQLSKKTNRTPRNNIAFGVESQQSSHDLQD